MDPTGPRLRYPQKLHFHPGASDRCGHAESGQGAEGVGMGYWEETAESTEWSWCGGQGLREPPGL